MVPRVMKMCITLKITALNHYEDVLIVLDFTDEVYLKLGIYLIWNLISLKFNIKC